MEIIERTLDKGDAITIKVWTDVLTLFQYEQILDFLLTQESFREDFKYIKTYNAVLYDFDETQKGLIGDEDAEEVFNSILKDTAKYEGLSSYEYDGLSIYITYDLFLLRTNGKRYCLEFIL